MYKNENNKTIIEWFKTNYQYYYNLMKNISHTHDNGYLNPYHMEGSIWNHTILVLEEISKKDIQDKNNYVLAALLHDIGKIYTRIEKNEKRVSFPEHENISTYLSIDILLEAEKIFEIDKLKILKFIAWHGTLWNKRDEEQQSLNSINKRFGRDLNFYYEFVDFIEADAFGRKFEEETEEDILSEKVNFFKNYVPMYEDKIKKHTNKKEVIFLIGPNGSNSSEYLINNCNKNKYNILSINDIMVKEKINFHKAYNKLMKNMNESIRKNKNIIIDMTNLDKTVRRKKLAKFLDSKYNKKAIVFLKGMKYLTKKNIKLNGTEFENYKIYSDTINEIKKFELPNYDEFDTIEFVF